MSNNWPPPFSGNISFNAQHSPMGAFMTFACGNFGTRGGIAAQIGKPANHDLFIGVKDGSRFDAAPLECLPFYSSARPGGAGAADFQGEQAGPSEQKIAPKVTAYGREEIRRHYGWATDAWSTDDFKFTIFTPFGAIPDPAVSGPSAMRHALIPAVVAELEVDNTRGKRTRTAFIAMNFNEPGWRPIEATGGLRRGFGLHRTYGILGEVVCPDSPKDQAAPALFCRWSPEQGIAEAMFHRLGSCPGLLMEVPPGERRILRLAIGCYIDGIVTTGLEGSYLYTRYFGGLEDVLTAALDQGDPRPRCEELDRQLLQSGLSADQQFMIAHATHSYYGSTQLLDVGGEPFWVVNEGEYCMMNTLDLSVDHMFWELDQNPWVVRNLLDSFVRHYSFTDSLKKSSGFGVQGSETNSLNPGGISFTHDMGAHNHFSPRGQSSYELPDLPAVCFSHMTGEQLCNWVLMATTYVTRTGDREWSRQNSHILSACLESLQRRGGESAIPSFDSARCGTGAEITTYDSLDHSLAQTRNSLYMAVKFWASFIGLGILFDGLKEQAHQENALRQATLAEKSILRHVGRDGVIPAVFEKESSGYKSRILPAAEGLLYPLMWGAEPQKLAPLLSAALKRHTVALLKDSEKRNLFPDGGIRLSSTSSNSWMSKIALFMHIARKIFQLDQDAQIASLFEEADRAHVKWQTDGSGYWACSDQFIDGIAKGSRWYPRIITSALWMRKSSW